MKIDFLHPDERIVALAARTILEGGVVLSPTDTVYGLACDPFSASALKRLCGLKGRPSGKGFLLLVEGIEQVAAVTAQLPKGFAEFAGEIWPGPVTVVLSAATILSEAVRGERGTVGCRRPDSPFLLRWLQATGQPIVSTSANLSGRPMPESLLELRQIFEDRVDLFLESGEPEPSPPSTVVDLTARPPRILRQGAGFDRLENALALLGP